jgi:hypothetical protein
MRKLLLTFVAITVMATAWATNKEHLTFEKGQNQLKVENVTTTGFSFNLKIGEAFINDAESKDGNFFVLQTKGFTKSFHMGNPNLPTKSKLIEIPFGADVKVKVVSEKFEIVDLGQKGVSGKVLPCQPSVAKCDDGSTATFEFNEKVYQTDAFYANELVKFEESGIMRGTRLGRIEMNPFQYNPVKNQLKVYTELTVEVTFEGADMAKTERMKDIYGNGFFNNMLTKTMNYNNDAKPLNQFEPIKMLIIADRMFEASLADFVDWKNMTGIATTVRYTDEGEVGNTTTSIQSFLQGVYDGATVEDPAPTFVLLVGDIQQVPTFDGTSGSHVSDLYYFTYDGPSDLIPDVNYGRFSAQTVAQLDIIIEKTLLYEKYEMSDPSYLDNTVLVAGVDGSYATVYGNGAINYINDFYQNDTDGVNANVYLYPASGSSAAAIIQNVSDGVAWGNYTAHCSSSGWADPSFTTSDIPGLQNAEKYGLLIGNCCLSNKFDDNECFGEALLRTADKGAIGYIGGSNSTYWDEDYWWATGNGTPVENPNYEDFGNGSYDLYYHENITDQPYSDWAPTQSQINLAGLLAVEESNSTRKTYYWEIYHVMGDPSLMPWVGVPDAMTPSYLSSIPVGLGSLAISGLPEYARVALSDNGTLVAAAVADATGSVTLEFTPFSNPTTADLVITAQWHQPYIGTLGVVPGDEPFIALNQWAIDDAAGNANSLADYGETISLNVNLKNVAASGSGYDATNIQAVLTTDDEYISITDDNESYGTINAGDSTTINGAFAFTIANNVPDQHEAQFSLLIIGDEVKTTWHGSIAININAPEFEISNLIISNDDDANGRIDPGETADISFTVSNVGQANAIDVKGILNGNSPYLTVTNEVTSDILANGSTTFTFNAAASDGAPQGSPVGLGMSVTSGDYSAAFNEEIILGQSPEIAIGNGTVDAGNYPFYTYYENNLTQMLYLGSEIGAGSVNIQEIALNFTDIGSESVVQNLSIKFIETSATELGTSYEDMSGANEVFSTSTYTMPAATGWHTFDISDYTFNASNNLLVQIVWGDNGSWSSPAYVVQGTTTGFTSVVYGYADAETPPAYDGNSTIRPNMMLYIEGEAPGTQYNQTFTVTDGTDPIEGAIVNVGGYSMTTDAYGITSLDLYEGDYYYSVEATGYEPLANTALTVSAIGTTDIQLVPLNQYSVTFTVTDGTNPLENSTVYFNDETLTTNSSGVATFTCFEGVYSYLAEKTGYQSSTAQTITVDQDLNIDITLDEIPTYTIIFNVTDGTNPMENASVTFNNETQNTNSSGVATFTCPDGVFIYSIEMEGYTPILDQAMIVDQNMDINITLEVIPVYNVSFTITDGTNPLENAAVTFNGELQNTNAVGNASFTCYEGYYSYSIEMDGYSPISDQSMFVNQDTEMDIAIDPLVYNVAFTVTDGSNPLENAEVTFNGELQNTNSVGIVTFTANEGDYLYSVELENYTSITNQSVSVNEDVNISVVIDYIGLYNVTFTITDGSDPIENANVTFNSITVISDVNGEAGFEVYEGSYNYSVEATGYEPINNESITINNDLEHTITLTPVGFENSYSSIFTIYPNPTKENVTIELANVFSGANATIMDMAGKSILYKPLELDKTIINLDDFSDGIYLIKIENGNSTYFNKLIIE